MSKYENKRKKVIGSESKTQNEKPNSLTEIPVTGSKTQIYGRGLTVIVTTKVWAKIS